jgi:hypothetical protein
MFGLRHIRRPCIITYTQLDGTNVSRAHTEDSMFRGYSDSRGIQPHLGELRVSVDREAVFVRLRFESCAGGPALARLLVKSVQVRILARQTTIENLRIRDARVVADAGWLSSLASKCHSISVPRSAV